MILKHWWKALAAILVLYSLLAGMLIPLRMGVVTDKTELTLKAGQRNEVMVNLYNARFSEEDPAEIKARLRLDTNKAICAENIQVIDDRNLKFELEIPKVNMKELPNSYPTLEIGAPKNGYANSEVFIRNTDSTVTNQGSCEVNLYPSRKSWTFPFLNILEESIRNLFYHVPMWFAMMLIFLVSAIYSILQLRKGQGLNYDINAKAFAGVGVIYGILGVVTGAFWAKHTWGAYWSWDIKQNTSAICLLIYLAYFVLRSSFEDADKRARIAAVYNIFAFATLIPLLYVIPRMVDSLHPGAEGNPAFSSYDLDNSLRLVFYPSVLGWMLLGIWIATIWRRIDKLKLRLYEEL